MDSECLNCDFVMGCDRVGGISALQLGSPQSSLIGGNCDLKSRVVVGIGSVKVKSNLLRLYFIMQEMIQDEMMGTTDKGNHS